MNKGNNKLSAGQLFSILALLMLIVGVLAYGIFFNNEDAKKLMKVHLTAEEIEQKTIEAVNKYNYGKMLLDQQLTLSDGTQYLEEFTISAEKDGAKRTYTYLTSDGSALVEYWDIYKTEDGDKYDVYIYSDIYETWVNTLLDEEPVGNDLWGMLNVIHGYTVLEDIEKWYVTGEDCYVLQLLGSSDIFHSIYEEMYINAETFLPVGIVEYCISEDSEKTIKDLTNEDLTLDMENYKIENIEIEHADYYEILRVYQLEYSNEDLAMTDKPETYISDEDYMYLESTYGQEESTEDNKDGED